MCSITTQNISNKFNPKPLLHGKNSTKNYSKEQGDKDDGESFSIGD